MFNNRQRKRCANIRQVPELWGIRRHSRLVGVTLIMVQLLLTVSRHNRLKREVSPLLAPGRSHVEARTRSQELQSRHSSRSKLTQRLNSRPLDSLLEI